MAEAELLAEVSDQRGLSKRDAEDRVHALVSPEVYQLLVVDRGWSSERYRQWLAATLADPRT